MTRDRFATRATIVDTAASLIAAYGVAQLGVNTLAHAAKCDKVLIYRYFGGLDGVLEAVAAERELWPQVELNDHEASDDSLADALLTLVLEEWAALSSSTLMLQASAAEASLDGSFSSATSLQREQTHASLIATLKTQHRVPPYVDLPAIVEILSAALTMFALRANHRPYGGSGGRDAKDASRRTFDPATPEGWRRIEKSLGAMTRSLLDASAR